MDSLYNFLYAMSGIQSKTTRHTRRRGKRKNTTETVTEMIQTLELSVTECKITVINMFKKLDDKISSENFIRDLKSTY